MYISFSHMQLSKICQKQNEAHIYFIVLHLFLFFNVISVLILNFYYEYGLDDLFICTPLRIKTIKTFFSL